MTALARLIAAVEGLEGPVEQGVGDPQYEAIFKLVWQAFPSNVAGFLLLTAISSNRDGRLDAAVAFQAAMLPSMLIENMGEMRSSGEMTGHWLVQLGPRAPRKRVTALTVDGLRAAMDCNPLESHPVPAHALVLATLKALQSKEGQRA